MARAASYQIAALDILDWLYFNQSLVLCVYGEQEQIWLHRLMERLRAEVEQVGATGMDAECLKHTVLCLMEISLQDPIDRLAQHSDIPLPPGLTAETAAKVDAYTQNFFMAAVIAIGEKVRKTPSETAFEIANRLLSVFREAPGTVKDQQGTFVAG